MWPHVTYPELATLVGLSVVWMAPDWSLKPLVLRAQEQTIVRVVRAELTQPHKELLAEDLVATITNEVELIRQGTAKAESGPSVERFLAGVRSS
jgi:hypothetical protein